jgi:hypothetical protein
MILNLTCPPDCRVSPLPVCSCGTGSPSWLSTTMQLHTLMKPPRALHTWLSYL